MAALFMGRNQFQGRAAGAIPRTSLGSLPHDDDVEWMVWQRIGIEMGIAIGGQGVGSENVTLCPRG